MLISMKQLLDEMGKMHQQGFIDETDVDQMNITVSNIQSLSDLLTRQVVLTENLFKFQIGADLKSSLVLTEELKNLIENNSIDAALLQGFNFEDNIDYKLLDSQAKLMNLNVRLQKSAFLPDIAAFYQHEKNFNTKSFTFNPPDLIGVSVSIPIFTSGSRLAKISQAKIGFQKAINTRDQVATGLQVDFESSKSEYLSSNDQFNTAKRNFELAKKIYNRTSLKYRNGMASSLELTQVQNQYFQSQTAYYTALISLVNAKNKLEKLLTKN
jgi:outer membrane protein TolC